MELPPPRYSEACKDSSPIIVTIDAECASIAQGNGYGQQELSENCLTVLAQGVWFSAGNLRNCGWGCSSSTSTALY